MTVLFVPLLFGIHHLYEWSHEDVVRQDIILQHKSSYLNVPFFIGRAAFYFALWLGLAWFLTRWSAEQDRSMIAPNAKIAAGYKPQMPPYKDRITENEMKNIVIYIRSLK